MSRVRLVVAALAGAVLATPLLVTPAEAATFTVSLTTNVTKADVGASVKLTGKVKGTGAGKAPLAVQRRYGSGAWSTIAKATTTSTGAYATSVKVTTAGAQSLRVVARKKGATAQGISPARALTGWAWLKLYDESYFSEGSVQRGWVGTVNGGTPPRDTFGLYSNDGASNHGLVAWRTDELCDRLTASIGISDSDDELRRVELRTGGPTVAVEAVPSEITKVDVSLTGTSLLSLRRHDGSGGGYVVVETPRARCKVARLPIAYD